jgi:hypothetical protein
VAAWGLFEKRDIQTLNRVASASTMDGYKIRAKLALIFTKTVANAEAEEIMMQYAKAFAAAIECELSNGELPFEEHELLTRITDSVQALPKKNVRLIGLHVWHKGAISSGSMLAVKPERDGKATVPAMPAVSQTRERSPSPAGAHTATTIKPPETRRASRAPESTPGAPAVTRPAPPPVQRQAPPSSSGRAPVSGPRASAPSSATVGGPPIAVSMPAAARMASGVVPAVEPRIVRNKSGFLLALEQCRAESGEEVGRAMAQPIRDAAAGVLLATLESLHATLPDPLALFDGRADAALRRGLVGEACVCACYVLYEALTRTSLPQMLSIEVVQGACVHALKDAAMPVSEISRYLATESPREEFAGHVCAQLGVRETPEMQQRIDASLRALRIDVRSCAEQIEQRLTRGKSTGQRTG